ncbi:MAG: hypothetical protein JWM36_2464 [Hyphomicrobiales bacterium]|nr:hypothetical protein [Hyphomicrobiales bacterium]
MGAQISFAREAQTSAVTPPAEWRKPTSLGRTSAAGSSRCKRLSNLVELYERGALSSCPALKPQPYASPSSASTAILEHRTGITVVARTT